MIDIHGVEWRDSNDKSRLHVDRIPDSCPVCHNAVNPVQLYAYVNLKDQNRYAQVAYRCPKNDCHSLFIASFRNKEGRGQFEAEFVQSQPVTPKEQKFAQAISQLSPAFCTIFNQSLAAEQQSLFQICGVGYRKALEFLIKDYLVAKDPKSAEKIQKKFLGKCIEQDVENPNIKVVAKRAAWLGNDETHYVREWKDQDLTDLKRLIKLAIDWIEMEKLTEEAIEEMPDNSK